MISSTLSPRCRRTRAGYGAPACRPDRRPRRRRPALSLAAPRPAGRAAPPEAALAQLLAQRGEVPGRDRVVRLVRLLQQELRERGVGLLPASTGRRRARRAGPSPPPRPAAGRRADPTSRTSAPARPARARGPAAGPARGRGPGRRPGPASQTTVPCAAAAASSASAVGAASTDTAAPAARNAAVCSLSRAASTGCARTSVPRLRGQQPRGQPGRGDEQDDPGGQLRSFPRTRPRSARRRAASARHPAGR